MNRLRIQNAESEDWEYAQDYFAEAERIRRECKANGHRWGQWQQNSVGFHRWCNHCGTCCEVKRAGRG